MKLFGPSTLTAFVSLLVAAAPHSASIHQQDILFAASMSEGETLHRVPGTNNATFGPIPAAEQKFEVEFLEMAPSPLPVDRIFFILLRGTVPPSAVTARGTPIDNMELAKATLSFRMSCVFPDGTHDEPMLYTSPLRTVKAAETAHLAIRDADGAYTEHMTVSRYNDIMGDMWIPGMFLRTGQWTFEVVAKLEDETCLFAMTLTQYLEGELQDPL